ncbi:hypothetical protein MnBA_40650 [Marinobacterium sp. BA1]
MGNYPLRHFSSLTHVGDVKGVKPKTGRFSYEGAGLSVSDCPDAWRRIGRGHVAGKNWALSSQEGSLRLIDYYAIDQDPAFQAEVVGFSVQEGLLKPVELWRVTFFDDELDGECFSDHCSYEEAFIEADEDETCITKIQGYQATAALCERANVERVDPVIAFEQAALVYLKEHTDAHGVWWQDTLDPLRYSAPRGVIFQSAISAGNISVTEEVGGGQLLLPGPENSVDPLMPELTPSLALKM